MLLCIGTCETRATIFIRGAHNILAVERLDGIRCWGAAFVLLDSAHLESVWSPSAEFTTRALATVFPKPFPVQWTYAMMKPDTVEMGQEDEVCICVHLSDLFHQSTWPRGWV
jgi:hypothetical protein